MLTDALETEFTKLPANDPAHTENENDNKNLLSEDQKNETKSIDSKSVTLADFKSKLTGSKTKLARIKSKTCDLKQNVPEITSLRKSTEEKDAGKEDDETNLSCLTEIYADGMLAEELPPDAGSRDSDSDFGEAECGEPTVTRQLTIDFTMMSEDDPEFVQKKCCDFWDFIYSNKQLQTLMVLPESDIETETHQVDLEEESVSTEESSLSPTPTAVEILQKHKVTEAVPWAFASKQSPSCRNEDCRTYCHGSCARLEQERMRKRQQDEAAKLTPKKHVPTIDTQPRKRSPHFVRDLCSELDAWDLQHPKSYDPPEMLCTCHQVPKPSPLTSSLTSSTVCTPDVTCLSCAHSAEDRLSSLTKRRS